MCKELNFVYMIDRMKYQYFDFFFLYLKIIRNRRKKKGKFLSKHPKNCCGERSFVDGKKNPTTTPSTNFSEIFHWYISAQQNSTGCVNVGRKYY